MHLSRLFKGPPPIRDLDGLAQFIDGNAAFLVQKGIYEYSRARAGHFSKVLFSEPAFLEAVERSRWRSFPLGLAMVGEVVDGVLRPHSGEGHSGQLNALRSLVLSILDRYPAPAVLDENTWRQARAELDRRLQMIGLHPAKRSFEISEPFAQAYFDLMPIDKSLRAPDFPTIRNYLKLTLCNMHIELDRRVDGSAVAKLLRDSAG
jgi:hypothetical protein